LTIAQFIGQNVDMMVTRFGPPASSFKMTSGGASYQWQLAGGTDIMGGNGIGIASQRYCKVNAIADHSGTVVDLKTDDTGSATSYGYFTVMESLCAKRFGMKKETGSVPRARVLVLELRQRRPVATRYCDCGKILACFPMGIGWRSALLGAKRNCPSAGES
jgi:hypothetical protein